MKLNDMQGPMGLLVLAALTQAPSPAVAQQADTRLDPVEVTSSRITAAPRLDVENICPGYGETVRDSLLRSIKHIDQSGETRVVFELKGSEIESVKALGGPLEYRRHVRRAVGRMSCAGDDQAKQLYSFNIVFLTADEAERRQSLAAGPVAVTVAMKD